MDNNGSRCMGKCHKLFVPSSKTSVIKHTDDLQCFPKHDEPRTLNNHNKANANNNNKIDKLDSGIDSWDEEEEKRLFFSKSTTSRMEVQTQSNVVYKEPSLSEKKNNLLEQLHSAISSTKSSITIPRDLSMNSAKSKTQEDGKNMNLDLKYLFCLYEKVQEGRLKNIVLKLIRKAADEECKKLNEMYQDKEKKSFNFGIDNLLKVAKDKDTSPQVSLASVSSIWSDTAFTTSSSYPSETESLNSLYEPATFYNECKLPFNCKTDVTTIKKSKQNPSEACIPCEYCHKTFSNVKTWQRHLLTHKGKRTHKCTQCSRSFYEQSSYLRHLKSHNGEKAHKCEQCSMAFSKRSALEVHIRTHTGERPFKCKFCGKGFSISGNLHRHVLIHTGHRPYKCGKCPRAFNNPSHLARHISSFHT